jgi:hypothetical protein
MAFADLPGRGERSVPSFAGGTEEVSRYFSELDNLLALKGITTDAEKKQGALKYLVTTVLKRMWKACETYSDVTKTYEDFKDQIYEFYPGSLDNASTVHQLDSLIGECARLGIKDTTELGEFHFQFRTIAKFLISKNRMSQAKESRGFLQVLGPDLEDCICQRLQNIKPNQDPEDPYDLKDLYNAAVFCLKGTGGSTRAAAPLNIKAELQGEVQSAIKSAMGKMTEMFKNIFAAQAQVQAQFSGGGQAHASPLQARVPSMLA